MVDSLVSVSLVCYQRNNGIPPVQETVIFYEAGNPTWRIFDKIAAFSCW